MKVFLTLTLCTFIISAQAALRVGSYNIRNFDYDQRSHVPTNKQELAQTLKEINVDFLGVQEINQTEVFEDYIKTTFSGKYAVALTECGGAHDQRLGFVYNQSLFELVSFEEDLSVSNPNSPRNGFCNSGSRPLAVGEFKIKKTGETFVAISLHLKSGGHPSSINKRFKQLELLNKVIQERRNSGERDFIVMGDFNTTEYTNRNGKEDFVKVVRKMGMEDVSANLSCTSYWWGGRQDGKQYPSQLDHILVSADFGKSAASPAQAYGHCAKLSCSVTRERDMGVSFDEVSDHCPIVTTLK